MSWSTPQSLKAQLERLWARGELLRDALADDDRFPLRLALKGPRSADVTDQFEAVRQWSGVLAGVKALRIEWQSVRHRVQGEQRLPARVWVDSRDQALKWLGKTDDWNAFARMVAMTGREQASLLPWLHRRPLQALALRSEWPALLAVVDWVVKHPGSGIYLRQVDISGVHTKFIEMHRGSLAELLDLALPAEAIDQTRTGAAQFAGRYGFKEKPIRIRFRVLDAGVLPGTGWRGSDLSLDAESFARLRPSLSQVFITENETNFLAFPPVPGAIVIFGAGYGWSSLLRCEWLHTVPVHYWGDIDTHGFAILDQLRAYFPHVQSLLMDRETLQNHTEYLGMEEQPLSANLQRLNRQEKALYDELRDNALGERVRLEQEFVRFGDLVASLKRLT